MPQTPPATATLVLLTALTVLTLNMFLPALPAMQVEFAVSGEVLGLAISGYMVCAAVLQLVLGPLSDRIGRRPVLLAVLVIYTISSVVAVSAQSFSIFLAARLMQAVAVGGGVIASAVVRDLFDGPAAAARLSVIAAFMAVAPMLAPMIGGAMSAQLGWRAIFVTYALLGLGLLVLVWRDLGETKLRENRVKASGALDLLFVPLFWAHTLCKTFSVGAFYIFVTGVPFVASAAFGLGAGQIGIGLGSITAGFMLGATFCARTVAHFGSQVLIFAGRAIGLVGICLGLLLFSMGLGSVFALFGATMLVGFGNGLTISNASAGALSVRPDLAGTAAGIAGAAMMAGGALLTSGALFLLDGAASPERLLVLMGGSVVLSTLAALAAWRLEVEGREWG